MRAILGRELALSEASRPSVVEGVVAIDTAIESNREFVEHGETLRSRLVAVVHGEEPARRRELRAVRDWQRRAFRISRGGAG